MRNRLFVAAALLTLTAALSAQSAGVGGADERQFEAVTIKPSLGPVLGPRAPDLFSRNYITLQLLMVYAYELPAFRIVGGPDWVRADHFDIAAKAGFTPTPAEMRAMAQRLLGERFSLAVRRETRELSTYDLVVARSDGRLGPGLTRATLDCEPFLTGLRPMTESPLVEIDGISRRQCSTGATFGRRGISPWLKGVALSRLADFLARQMDRAVVDKTRLAGTFDVELNFTSENLPPELRGDSPDIPALHTAVSEQLGLRLVSTRGPVEMLVIESAARPSEN